MAEGSLTKGKPPPTLSAILPNFNHGRYLPRALDALLAQERLADEIIVIDDGSTDDSREIIARYAAQHPSIRPLPNEENVGVIETLTRGLNAARGTYVYFGAADDFVLPGFFASGLAALKAHPDAGMFCGEMILVDGKSGKPLGYRPPVRPRLRAGYMSPAALAQRFRHADNFLLTGAAILRRDAAIQAGGFDPSLSTFADGYLVRKVALGNGMYYAPQACLTWCIFPDSVSRTTSTDLRQARQVFGAIQARMTVDPAFPRWYWPMFARRWRFSLCRLAVHEDPVNVAILEDLAIQSGSGGAILRWALRNLGRKSAQLAILAWLWLKLRPYSLTRLAATSLARAWQTRSGSK